MANQSQPTEAESLLDVSAKLGLLPEEYHKVVAILGRQPNFTELSIFSVMWSEHCSYKNSIVWLKKLPKDSDRMLAKAGEENAGLVDIGDGLACSFKIESHNHPSALEPYQGAATGVGGINRDIFTMGARPIAQLNSLRFGNPNLDKTKWLVKGVVKGIGDYGNAFGIPTVGGEVYFDDVYNVNPLVNAFSAGIVEVGKSAKAIAYGDGNPVYIVGSATGKDGIHGATFASEDITDASTDKLPAVQVGDPFQEKLLLEASLEVLATGKVIGIQDMGAAGIICSTSEMSAKGNAGMVINLDKVPTRQPHMKPFEILLSESQERMLVVIEQGSETLIEGIFDKWDLHCQQIGIVNSTGRLHFYQNETLVADVPAEDLVLGGGAPVYHREWQEPAYFKRYKLFDPKTIPQPDYHKVALHLSGHPNLVNRGWITKQYDSMVGTVNTNTNNPSDAAVVNIKGTKKGIVISVDCNGRYVQSDPETGCTIAVAEACRNVVCSGGTPVAITNNLNFGNPYNKEVYWQFVGAVKGMITGCNAFKTPVTGGNVSFYNQSSSDGPVFPTPTIGMLGLIDDVANKMVLGFQKPGHIIAILGVINDDISCSEYLYSYIGVKESPAPYFNLDEELAMQSVVTSLITDKLIASAHDVSDGGIFTTMQESAIALGFGYKITTPNTTRKDAFLFGEAQGRVIISFDADLTNSISLFCQSNNVPLSLIGTVEAQNYIVDSEIIIEVDTYKDLHFNTLDRLFNS